MRDFHKFSISALALLIASPALAQNAPNIREITSGQTIRSTMETSDARLSSDNSPIETFKVRARSGQRIVATMTSEAFQPIISMGTIVGGENCENCSHGTMSDDLKTTIARRVASSDGYVIIRTNTLEEANRGDYSLNVVVSDIPQPQIGSLRYGRPAQGVLNEDDAVTDNGEKFDSYSIRLRKNQEIQIDASSEVFDTMLRLSGPDSEGVLTEISTDDDSGPGLNSRIRYKVTRDGTYRVRVSTVGDSDGGSYTLLVGDKIIAQNTPAIPLNIGQTAHGIISDTQNMEDIDGDEVAVSRFSVNLEAGKAYWISAKSNDFDVKFDVGNYNADNEFESVVNDDDSGGGTDARARFKPTTSGNFIIRVTKFQPSSEADNEPTAAAAAAAAATAATTDENKFTLEVTEALAAPVPTTAAPINLGQTINNNLHDGGPRRDGDQLYNIYSVNLAAGQKITISMTKSAEGDVNTIDPFIEIGNGTIASFNKLAEDDDGGASLNSRLRFEAPSAGVYLIRASTVMPTQDGDYQLNVINTPPPVPPPAPTPIVVGNVVNGELTSSDPVFGEEERNYDLYSFNGQIGEIYTIELSSEQIDSFVGARAQSQADSDYQTDDDSGGGLNSKLEYAVTINGPQIIRVSSFSEQSNGNYSLKVTKKSN